VKPGAWPPAILLAIGALLATVGVRAQRTLALRTPLGAAVPDTIERFGARDLELSAEEVAVAGVTSYLARVYTASDTALPGPRLFTVYVGYYDRQASGKTIHSPKNCLPGAGWEPLTSEVQRIATPAGEVEVNRYLLQKGPEQALVLYWYQGRGRVRANEYRVKWDLVRDAALRRRSEEALVRIVVPVRGGIEAAAALAGRVATQLVPDLRAALPS